METPKYFTDNAPSGNPSRIEADLIRAHERQNQLPPAPQHTNETYASWEYRTGR